MFRLKGKNLTITIAFITVSFLLLFVSRMIFDHRSFWTSFVISILPVVIAMWVPFTILSAIVYLIQRSRVQKELNKQILKQSAEAELALLKAQLNPHFLFNTLNNIDTLIQVDEKQRASESLIRMSEMMRYTTYESSNDMVLLADEIAYLNNYIELEMLRSSNKELVKLDIRDDVGEFKVAPMLLIPFVENAFKHSSDKRSIFAIRVGLEIAQGNLIFTCANKYDENSKATKDKSSGVGLQNIQRRLNLLYPDKHELCILKENGVFDIRLILTQNGN
ncbi:sensor histidine kinase [Desertivirga brevis]|uniref:sensor histidine kinase n=1 Tax=Desertivirga brevis TaxID=2810310 RepID=UPI001A970FB0|nr:histidine kinase [Pedobacter sp. SYSU D00873]